MPNQLDELSVVIGDLRRAISYLTERATEDRKHNDEKHVQNQAQIGSIKVLIGDLAEKIDKQNEKLNANSIKLNNLIPQILELQGAKRKLAAYATVGVATIATIGVLFETAIKALWEWLMHKLGG